MRCGLRDVRDTRNHRQVALAVGARSEEVPGLSRALIERGHIKHDVARELLAKLRGQS